MHWRYQSTCMYARVIITWDGDYGRVFPISLTNQELSQRQLHPDLYLRNFSSSERACYLLRSDNAASGGDMGAGGAQAPLPSTRMFRV